MLPVTLIVLFIAIKLAERFLPTFTARKVTHFLSGLILVLVPFPLAWESKVLIALFSAFVVWRSLIPRLEEKLGGDIDSEAERDDQPDPIRDLSDPHDIVVKKFLRRFDLGILLFAIVINFCGFADVSYRWMLPLFVGDPAGALVGNLNQLWRRSRYQSKLQHEIEENKTLVGSLVFFLCAWYVIYRFWVPAVAQGTYPGLVSSALAAMMSTAVEFFTGKIDNLSLGVSGWIFSKFFDASMRSNASMVLLFVMQSINVLGLRVVEDCVKRLLFIPETPLTDERAPGPVPLMMRDARSPRR